MSLCRALRRLGSPREKKSPHAPERGTPEVREQRREFAEDVGPIEPNRPAFADETGVATAMTPACGRAPGGERVEAEAPASRGPVTVIAARGPGGVRAPLAFEGAVDAAIPLAYAERVLVPALRRGDVAAFDNLSAHPSPAVSGAIERAGASVLPLPPYSPDSNPIGAMFSKPKGPLRRVGARAEEHRRDALGGGDEGPRPGTSSAGSGTPDCVPCRRDPL